MGLDNGFLLKSKDNPNLSIRIVNFKNYYELNDYFKNKKDLKLTKHDLKVLRSELDFVYRTLKILPGNTVLRYDDDQYPPKLWDICYGHPFSPTDNSTGIKLIKLYENLNTMIDILDYNEDDLYYEFYSSY